MAQDIEQTTIRLIGAVSLDHLAAQFSTLPWEDVIAFIELVDERMADWDFTHLLIDWAQKRRAEWEDEIRDLDRQTRRS